jgi:hypothetical protein
MDRRQQRIDSAMAEVEASRLAALEYLFYDL